MDSLYLISGLVRVPLSLEVHSLATPVICCPSCGKEVSHDVIYAEGCECVCARRAWRGAKGRSGGEGRSPGVCGCDGTAGFDYHRRGGGARPRAPARGGRDPRQTLSRSPVETRIRSFGLRRRRSPTLTMKLPSALSAVAW